MKQTIFIALAIVATAPLASAQIKPYTGSTKSPNAAYKEHYTVNGSVTSEPEAFMGAIQGKEVYRCVLQEASMGKSGKSASLRNVKKNQ